MRLDWKLAKKHAILGWKSAKQSLYYWARKAKNSSAEVDYLIELKGTIIPMEIKSGSIGHMRSMHMFIEKYQSEIGVKISMDRFHKGDKVLSLPLYAIEAFLARRDALWQ